MLLIQPLEYKNQRILTTQQLAEGYDTETQVITNNFNRNKERFIEGKHFYCLEGDILKNFKTTTQIELSLKIKKLYLWTEKGALLHAKSLNTDKAWEVYEQLVDYYFNQKSLKLHDNQIISILEAQNQRIAALEQQSINQLNGANSIISNSNLPVKEIPRGHNPIVYSYLQAIEQAIQSGEYYLRQKHRTKYTQPNSVILGVYDEFCYYLIAIRAFEIYTKADPNPCGIKTLYALMRSENIIKTHGTDNTDVKTLDGKRRACVTLYRYAVNFSWVE